MRPTLEPWLFVATMLGACTGQSANSIPRPDQYVLERMVGNPLDTPVRVSAWKAPEPQRTNLFLYSVTPPRVDEALMHRVAARFSITGEIAQIKGDTLGHIGFEIREPNPTNSNKIRRVYSWLTMGSFGYDGADDGYAWDIPNHRPLMRGIPDKDEAKKKALELLSLLGVSTNELEHHTDGRLKWASSTSTVGYTDRADKQRKKAVLMQTVSLSQRVPFGGTTVGVGDGGKLAFSFVSEGKVSRIEWFFRTLVKAREAKSKTSKEVIKDVAKGNAWTWHQRVPARLTVTDCVLAYPQGNSWLHQEYVWPFYMLTATGADGREVTLYVPLEW